MPPSACEGGPVVTTAETVTRGTRREARRAAAGRCLLSGSPGLAALLKSCLGAGRRPDPGSPGWRGCRPRALPTPTRSCSTSRDGADTILAQVARYRGEPIVLADRGPAAPRPPRAPGHSWSGCRPSRRPWGLPGLDTASRPGARTTARGQGRPAPAGRARTARPLPAALGGPPTPRPRPVQGGRQVGPVLGPVRGRRREPRPSLVDRVSPGHARAHRGLAGQAAGAGGRVLHLRPRRLHGRLGCRQGGHCGPAATPRDRVLARPEGVLGGRPPVKVRGNPRHPGVRWDPTGGFPWTRRGLPAAAGLGAA